MDSIETGGGSEDNQIRNHRYHNLEPFRDRGSFFWLRQWLNIIFIIGAIVGIIAVYVHSRELGIYIFIGASALKFIELTLRMLKL